MLNFIQPEKEQHEDLELHLFNRLDHGLADLEPGNQAKTLDELVSYTGPDRQKIITEGAKAEGKVVWYTSLSGNYREIVDAFKKKYPEIQVEVYRAGSSDVAERLMERSSGWTLSGGCDGNDSRVFDAAAGERNSQTLLRPSWRSIPKKQKPKPTPPACTGSPTVKLPRLRLQHAG